MKRVLNFLLSLNTAFGLFLAGILICFVGSLMLPANLAFFSGIDDTPLFQWLTEAGNLRLTWWIYALIAVMTLLSLSTVLCTMEALLKGLRGRNLIARLSPQVMHLGVLFVLLGHLLSDSLGTKADLLILKDERKPLAGKTELLLTDVVAREDEAGYTSGWEARLMVFDSGERAGDIVLRPAHPVNIESAEGERELFLRSINTTGEPSALIRVCWDPGALWAFIGGILVSLGGMGFIHGRYLP